MPVVGMDMLIVLPFGFVICGHVEERLEGNQFRIVDTSLICRTGGTPWDLLADGEGRDKATFRPWGDVWVGPEFVLSREWKRGLPCK